MRQLILPDTYDGSSSFALKGGEFHYLVRVLRRRPGDSVPALDHRGRPLTLHIESIDASACLVRVVAGPANASEAYGSSDIHISLLQCLPKGQKMDLIVRQATETGVRNIVPLLSEHTVPVLKGNAAQGKRERWLRVAKQAMQQSGNRIMPEISTPKAFGSIVSFWNEHRKMFPEAIGLFFHQDAINSKGLHSYLGGNWHGSDTSVAVCIGPEGGFSAQEVKNLLNIAFHPVYIKTNVFRTETAALYAIAAIQTVLLEKNLWSVPE